MITASQFKPAWWLANAHSQTLGARILTPQPPITVQRERIELPDGDFVDIDWAEPPNDKGFHKAHSPIVIVLHGLGGSIASHYAKPTLDAIIKQGWRGAFLYFRGCSGEPNRLPRCYHSGDTLDLDYVVQFLRKRDPHCHIAAVGFSLGGNVLLKWLGETKDANVLESAVAISVPFDLSKAANRMLYGFPRFYQWWLLRELHQQIQKKFTLIQTPIDLTKLLTYRTFWEFDTFVTAPLHGFKDAVEYYSQSSCRQFLNSVVVPTLIIHSQDDPFMTPDAIPTAGELSQAVTLELSESGGHVGFIAGERTFQPSSWLQSRIVEYLRGKFG